MGVLLRGWRQQRGLSQLDLAGQAGVSSRHLSFLETGRARPSREMVLHLAEQLDVPLRERNTLLVAAGFAPSYRARALDAPEMASVRDTVDRILAAHEPYPAVVVDRMWNIVALNGAAGLFTEGAADHLLQSPANALRITLHPDGMAGRIVNLSQWRDHLLLRLHRQVLLTGDSQLRALEEEVRGYPHPAGPEEAPAEQPSDLAVPLTLRHSDQELTFISTIATFGTAIDITVAELAIESFFPADVGTAGALRAQ